MSRPVTINIPHKLGKAEARHGIEDGFRVSAESRKTLLRELKERGLQEGPRLAVGDGALGFGSALREVYPDTRAQRCWVHKTLNVLDCLPKSLQGKAKSELHAIWMAETRDQAHAAFERFMRTYQAKCPKAVDKLLRDREVLLAFYDFPAEHWRYIRSTNPVESTFATIRYRSTRAKNCVSRATLLGLVYRLAREAEKSWQRTHGFERIADLDAGVSCQYRTKATLSGSPPEMAHKSLLTGAPPNVTYGDPS